jgi:hypothetical protein
MIARLDTVKWYIDDYLVSRGYERTAELFTTPLQDSYPS